MSWPKRARKAPERLKSYVTGSPEPDIEDVEEEAPRRAPRRRQPAVKKESVKVEEPGPVDAAAKEEEHVPDVSLSPPVPVPKARAPARQPKPPPTASPTSTVAIAPSHPSQRASAVLPYPRPGQRITLTRAKETYKLNDREVKSLPCERVENPRSADYAPMQLYDEEEVYLLALEKWGSAEGVVEAQQNSRRRGAARKATLERKKKEAEEEDNVALRELKERQAYVELWLAAVGAPAAAAVASPALQEFLNSGIGVEAIAQMVNEAKAAYEARRAALEAALVAAGLNAADADLPAFESYFKGVGGEVDAAGEVQRYVDAVSRIQRAHAVDAAVVAAGLPVSKIYNPAFDAYRATGEGLEEAVAAVAGEAEARHSALLMALAALGLPASHAKKAHFKEFLSIGNPEDAADEVQAYAAAMGL